MIRRPQRSTRTVTLLPYTTRFRSRAWSRARSRWRSPSVSSPSLIRPRRASVGQGTREGQALSSPSAHGPVPQVDLCLVGLLVVVVGGGDRHRAQIEETHLGRVRPPVFVADRRVDLPPRVVHDTIGRVLHTHAAAHPSE